MAGIVPTKSNLMAAQKSLKLAKLGYELMDRKKNILIKELLSLAADAKTIRADTEKAFSEAYESLRHAEMTLGRCGTFALSVPGDDGLSLSAHSVMGVELPDIRYKELSSIENLPSIQREILHGASAYVKPGGTLVYSTSTLRKAENEEVLTAFLADHPDFTLTPFDAAGIHSEGMLTLLPHLHGTDGFFVAKMTKKLQ